ncbi:MAG: metalloregulator ArsR/SmtB family transcription factor [Pseudomonadota bacterium]
MNIKNLQEGARAASAFLKALGNENRIRILCELAAGERSVGELAARIGLSQSALSQHLARLRGEGLVKTRRQAQTIYYSLASTKAAKIIEILYDLYCAKAKG